MRYYQKIIHFIIYLIINCLSVCYLVDKANICAIVARIQEFE